ncbi:hypothetical protein Zmor_006701 [Zophobas morio]|uniref:Uncharacterized protein n=1 Tax=Zophobas morio TaxID=2755281 RepID=A0AA38MNN1_9CUCU|nr:hypothetical protein Zmor_006701 [Zophobas morio]
MALKHHNIILLVALTLWSADPSTCRGLEKPVDVNNINALLNNPNVKNGILNAVLQNQGTSADRIQDIINAADGNLDQAVSGINSELNANVLNINGEAVTINSAALGGLLKSAVQASVQKKLSNAPELAAALQSSIDQQISAGADQFNAVVELSAIPIDVAQQSLSVDRRKRSLDAKTFDLGQIVSDLVFSILQTQLGPIINGVLDNVKEILNGLLIVTGSGDPILDFLSGLLNFVVKGLIQVITSIQQTLTPAATSSSTAAEARRKRDLIGDITNGIGDVVNGVTNGGGLLDGIVGPVIAFLANILTPVNNLLKSLVAGLGGLLQPILGDTLLTPITNVINAIIDLLIPANQA